MTSQVCKTAKFSSRDVNLTDFKFNSSRFCFRIRFQRRPDRRVGRSYRFVKTAESGSAESSSSSRNLNLKDFEVNPDFEIVFIGGLLNGGGNAGNAGGGLLGFRFG